MVLHPLQVGTSLPCHYDGGASRTKSYLLLSYRAARSLAKICRDYSRPGYGTRMGHGPMAVAARPGRKRGHRGPGGPPEATLSPCPVVLINERVYLVG